MKFQLPKLLVFLLLIITSMSCVKDDFDAYSNIASVERVTLEDEQLEDLDNTFDPEIILTHCFAEGTKCSIDNPNNEIYVYKWSHDGMAIGHDTETLCLCGGLLELDLTRLADGATFHASIEMPDCSEEVK